MARRSLFVAIAAIAAATAAAALPTSAYAATPALTSAEWASPVGLQWAADATVSESLFRAAGACAGAPSGGTLLQTTALPTGTSTASDSPGDGVFCYYVESDSLPATAGLTVTVDTVAPTAPLTFTASGAPNYLHNTIALGGTPADAGTGVASNVLRRSDGGACVDGPAINAAWDTTTVADATYTICRIVTDGADHTTTTTATVVVDNTDPGGEIATPAAGTAVTGNAVSLTIPATDATAGVRNVQWQRSPNGNTNWANIGQVVTGGPNYQRNWNTNAGAVGDGPDYLRALINDNAGNQDVSATVAVTVDNTNPDAKAVVTAPPAVAGSPTLSWTPAHDAVGIARYDVLRGANVVGTVASTGAQSYSYNDKNAPDQATSSYVVRAYDATNHFIDSDAVAVLVDSKAQSAPQGLGAATPTAAAPALSWQAPPVFTVDHYDVYRDGLLLGSTAGAATTYSDASAIEGVHDYAVLARSASAQPGVLSTSFKVLLDKTPPTSGGAPTAQVLPTGVQLAWPAAGDALSGLSGYVVRRAAGGVPPAASDGGSEVCAPAATATGCADGAIATGTWSYGVFAKDGAGNIALIGTVAGVTVVDKTAPLAPTKLTLVKQKAKKPSVNFTYTLRWVAPTAADLERVVVVLNLQHAPTAPADGKAIYKGLGTSTKVTLRAGQTGYLAIYAFDKTGNASPSPARKIVNLAGLIPLRPLNGSVVRSSSPKLSWKAVKGIAYYNVQVFLKGKRVLTGWPSQASFTVPKGKLKPGTYVWFVWPAVKGKGSSPKFGKLIGRATFTYKKK